MGSFMDMEFSTQINKQLIGQIKSIRPLLGSRMDLISNIREDGIWIRDMDLAKLTLPMVYGQVILRLISQTAMERGSLPMAKEKLAYGRMDILKIIESIITNLYYLFYQLLFI